MAKMTKSATISYLAAKTGLSKKLSNQFVEELVKLVLVNRAARMGRNPATGATIQIPAKRVVKFRIAKQAKVAILG